MTLPTLDELALKHGTDKASDGHGYCQVYEELFAPLRDEPVALLELGVAGGASLRTWAEYFTHPDTIIAGIDIDLGTGGAGCAGSYLPLRQRYGKPLPGIVTYLGDQAKIPSGLRDWHPDIIIDDASHISSKTIASFYTWFPVLASGGLYVVEDVVTSYDWVESCYESNPDPCCPPPGGGQTTMQFLKRLADEVQARVPANRAVGVFRTPIEAQYRLGFDIDHLSFHPNLVIARKSLREHGEELP